LKLYKSSTKLFANCLPELKEMLLYCQVLHKCSDGIFCIFLTKVLSLNIKTDPFP